MSETENNLYLFVAARALTIREAAESLGVSVGQVRALVADGVLAAIDIGRGSERRHVRLTEAAIEALSAPRPSPRTGPAAAARLAIPAEGELEMHGSARRRAERQAAKAARASDGGAGKSRTTETAPKGAEGDPKPCSNT